MLKSGLFSTPSGDYTVYEIVEKGFHRIDFVTDNADFQVDFDKVAYSQVRRKGTRFIGDQRIYDTYLRVKETIESANFQTIKDAKWEDGSYVTTIKSNNAKLNYVMETKSVNGQLESYTAIGDGYTITSYIVDPIYGIKMEPMNYSEYTTSSLLQDTVSSSTDVVFYDIETLRRRLPIDHIYRNDYVVATNIEIARKRLKQFKKDSYPLRAFDTETTGLDVDMYGEDKLVGIILGTNETTATYFPFRHEGDFNLPIEFLDELMKVVISMQDVLVAHNKKFDRKVMLKEGYDLRIRYCSMQLSIVLNPTVTVKGIHSLKYLSNQITGLRFLELDDIFVNSKFINFAKLTPELILPYACPDGTNPLIIMKHMLKELPKYQTRLFNLESDLSDLKADQEFYGIRVDIKRFEKQYKNCNYIIDMLLKAFRTLTKEDININSGPALQDLLYNKMHCKVLLRTKTGVPSTSAAAIKKLAGIKTSKPRVIKNDLMDMYGNVIIEAKKLSESEYPALVILSKYREYNKLKTAFYSRFERTMKTGRVFFWINQNGAATGRQSSPMHQLPRDLKEIILSDAEDRDFWGPDFSQIELRMIAYLAGEKNLIELAKDPDNDIHRIIGSLITKKEMWEITPEERSTGKRRNFGVVYLISAMGLAGQIFGPGYTKENVKFCQQQLDEFYSTFKRIDRYIKGNAAKVQKRGYMETAWFHRRRNFDEIFDPDIEPSRLSSLLRMANNVPVQGTAADYMKVAEVQMYNYIRDKGWNELRGGFPRVRVILSIHDEAIISVDNSIPYEEIIEMIVKCMETPVDDAPPFFVQPARMPNWEGHSNDALAMPIGFRDKVIEDYHKTGKSVFKQSFFKLVMPNDIKSDFESIDMLTANVAEKYLSLIRLEYLYGDYVTEYTNEHLKDALNNYINSGTLNYRIDNYIELLNSYRMDKLKSYMSELIAQYGTDYKEVSKHVRHPSLTFQLLDVYDKEIDRHMEHADRITEATRLYIDELRAGKDSSKLVFKVKLSDEIKEPVDKDLFAQQLEPLVDFDSDGNVIYTDTSEENSDISEFFWDDDPDDIILRVNTDPTFVWEFADTIVFDVQDLSEESINKVLSYIYQHKESDGFYTTQILYNYKLMSTGIKVESINIDEANAVLRSLQQKEILT